MGFRYRKSINLGKGFRVNMSKSGPGFSWGGKGFRLTRTAKGNIRGTAYIPGTGVSYQKEFKNPFNNTKAQKATTSKKREDVSNNSKNFTNDIGNIRSGDMGELVAAKKQNKTNKIIAGILVLAGIGLAIVNPLFLIISALGLVFGLYSKNNDTIKIDYDFTDEAAKELSQTNKLLEGIMESDEVWLVTEAEELSEETGADMKILSRMPIRYYKGNEEIETNAETFTLDATSSKFIFLPDSIVIKEGSKVNALNFKDIDINLGKMTFLEDQTPAKDATVLGKTYEHTNKDGSPDRRYKENREVYLVEYGFLSLYNSTGLDTLIVFSDTVLDGE